MGMNLYWPRNMKLIAKSQWQNGQRVNSGNAGKGFFLVSFLSLVHALQCPHAQESCPQWSDQDLELKPSSAINTGVLFLVFSR